MPKRRLARLTRLQRIRAVAAIEAGRRSAEAEGSFSRLDALARRSQDLAAEYAARGEGLDAGELYLARQFYSELAKLGKDTASHAKIARKNADNTRTELVIAQRRAEQVEERLVAARRQMAQQTLTASLHETSGRKKQSGTQIE